MSLTDRAPTVLQISDTHLQAAADSRMRGVPTYQTFLAVLAHAQHDRRWPPDAILATGDIVQDESRAGYVRFRETLEPLDVPVLTVPGNHDDPRLMSELLDSAPFQFCGEHRLGGWSLILLSTFLPGADKGEVGATRLSSLRAALGAHAGRHTLVCMHHHPLPMDSAWLDGVSLRDSGAFWEVVDAAPNVRGVVCGHVHQVADRQRGRVRFLSTPSTCAQFLPRSEHFAIDTRPPGMRWLTLLPDGAIDTQVEWTAGEAWAS